MEVDAGGEGESSAYLGEGKEKDCVGVVEGKREFMIPNMYSSQE